MVKFVKKRKSNLKKSSAKKLTPNAEVIKPLLHKAWKPTKDQTATHPLKIEEVASSVNALLQVIKKKKEENKKSLFKDDSQEIMLQVQAIKVPETHKLQLRATLPHSLAKDRSDICFITPNVKESSKDDNEPTIVHYKQLLEKENITNKIQIVPIRQLRSEYMTYEAKGRFASLYDLYVVDGRLLGKVTKIVGSRFFRKHNMLLPVKVNTNRFKIEMEKALSKTSMMVHGNGDSYMVQVGYSHFKAEELVENICAIATMLANRFPGGFTNIRRMFIKSKFSIAIPIYISLTPSNEVPVPVVAPHLPKAYKTVEGELTTILGGHVKVHPGGEVQFKRVFTAEDEDMGIVRRRQRSEEEESDVDEEVSKVVEKKPKMEDEEVDSEDEDDDEDVETAEDAYMQELQDRPKQQPADQNTNVKGKKKGKVITQLGKNKGGLSTEKSGSEKGPVKKKQKKKQKAGVSALTLPVTGTSQQTVHIGKGAETQNKSPFNKKKLIIESATKAESQKKAFDKNMKNKGLSSEGKKKGTLNKSSSKMQVIVTPTNKEAQTANKMPGGKIKKKLDTSAYDNDQTPNKMKIKSDSPNSKKLRKLMRTNTPDISMAKTTPRSSMKFTEETIPVPGKSSANKKQSKKNSRPSFVAPEKEVLASPQKTGKRRESSIGMPKIKKMKAGNGLDISFEHKNIPVNGEAFSAKSLKKKINDKSPKSAKKRKSAISDKVESGDGSFTRYFSKENQKT